MHAASRAGLLLATLIIGYAYAAGPDAPLPDMSRYALKSDMATVRPAVFAQIGPGPQWTGATAGGFEVSLLGSGSGVPAITCDRPGASWLIKGGGVFSTALTPGNITPRVRFGSASVTRPIGNILASASNAAWRGEILLTCVTIGTAGTMRAAGKVDYATSDTGEMHAQLNNDGAVITLDNTVAMPVDIRVLMANPSATNTFRLDVLTIGRVY